MESVFVLKIFKNFKNCATLFWRLTLAGQSSREAPVVSLLKSSCDSLASQAPSHKKDLEKFQIFWVFSIFTTHFGNWFVSGSSSCEFTQNVSWLPSRLTLEWTFQSRKTLKQIFQNLSHGILAIWPSNLLATYSSREKRVFCTNKVKSKTIFKKFSVFPCIMCCFVVSSTSPSSKTTIFTHKTSIFFINPSPIFKKRYGFSLFLKVFHVSSPWFLGFCVVVEIWKYDVRIWFVDILLSLMYGFCWFW